MENSFSNSSSLDEKSMKKKRNKNKTGLSSDDSVEKIIIDPKDFNDSPIKVEYNNERMSYESLIPPKDRDKIEHKPSVIPLGISGRSNRVSLKPSIIHRNKISPPCQSNRGTDCTICNKRPLNLHEFKKKVSYQVVKLGNRAEGIMKLDAKEKVEVNEEEELQEFDCDFLQDWVKTPNKCKFLIIVAMYNEVCDEFDGTLEGIKRNINHFMTEGELKDINDIGVVFIIDGIEPFLKSFLKMDGNALKGDQKKCFRKNFSYFSQFFNVDLIKETFGIEDPLKKNEKYDFELMKDLYEAGLIKETQEIAHLFCQKVEIDDSYSLNTIFCVKHLNKRKLNTHRWFFEGFCSRIKPDYVALLDVGTIPEPRGLYLLFDAMEKDNRIAGCCGEIIPETLGHNWNPIVWAQVVEYKFSHIMDKGLESIIGYVSVLPGAFSAYRWDRLNDAQTLDAYFLSQRPGAVLDLFNANMYLAEDRILCMELMCQKKQYNILRFVKGSEAKTDVPDTINQLMAQRRRWVNGSWFSMIYTIKNCRRIGDSEHSWLRKFLFKSLMLYYAIIALFNWVLVGSFYLAFLVSIKMNLGESDLTQDKLTKYSTPFIFLYGCILCALLIISFAVKPAKVESLYRIISTVLGLYTVTTIFLTVFYLFRDQYDPTAWKSQLSASMIIVLGLIFIVIILLNMKTAVKPVATGILSYIFMTGTYVNIFLIYSICNIHDVSWGNRPDKMTDEERKKVDEYKNERTRWVFVWIFCNAAFAYLSNIVTSSGNDWSKAYILVLGLIAYMIIIFKFIGGFLYVLDENCCNCFHTVKNNK